jgi:serine/threonine protein kinase
MDTEDDSLLGELAAARPRQTDACARALHRSVRRNLVGADDEPFRLGRFTVLGPLGGGGMGTVFLAYDPDLDRKIALKVLHTRGERGRKDVLREGRALARLRHPHVVTVFEVGVADDQVFVAMEYVSGVDLRAWLRDRRPAATVLALLIEAGQGLAAAHDAGLVHLDFKPDNLVVDATGHARVIDFGLARDLADVAPARAGATATAPATSTRGGTPAYMAPERLHGARGDPRSDQYSFCVTCWEALTGQRPRSADDPPPTRLSARILAALRRGMRPDPADRFPTMHALLALLAARTTRRRAAVLALTATAGLALAAYAVGQRSAPALPRCVSPWPRVEATWHRARADEVGAAFTAVDVPFARDTWATARSALDRYADAWTVAHQRTCEDAVLRGTSSPTQLEQRLACLEDRRLHLANLVDSFAAADARTVTEAVTAIYRLPEIDACAALGPHDALFTGDPPRVAEVLAIRDQLAEARAELELRSPAAAQPLIDAAVARARELASPTLLADALNLAAVADNLASRVTPGLAHARDALRLAVAVDEPTQAASAAVALTTLLADLPDDTQTARGDLLTVAAAYSRRAGRPPQLQTVVDRARANSLMNDGHHGEASAVLMEAVTFAERHGNRRAAASALGNLGKCRDMLGDHQGAAAAFRQGLAELEPIVGAMHPWTGAFHLNLGSVLVELGDFDGAFAQFELVRRISAANYPDGHPLAAAAHLDASVAHSRLRHHDQAIAESQAAVATSERLFGPDHRDVAQGLCNLANALHDGGRHEEAFAASERALTIQGSALPPTHCEVMQCTTIHGYNLRSLGRNADAVRVLDEALTRFADSECPRDTIAELIAQLAHALWDHAGPRGRARVDALIETAHANLDPRSSEHSALRRLQDRLR